MNDKRKRQTEDMTMQQPSIGLHFGFSYSKTAGRRGGGWGGGFLYYTKHVGVKVRPSLFPRF